MKTCKRCGETKPREEFRKVHSQAKEPKLYYSNYCLKCDSIRNTRSQRLTRIKHRLNEKLKEAPYRAAVKMMKEDSSVLDTLIRTNPAKYRALLTEERKTIVLEEKERSISYSSRHMTEVAIEQLRAEWDRVILKLFKVLNSRTWNDYDNKVA